MVGEVVLKITSALRVWWMLSPLITKCKNKAKNTNVKELRFWKQRGGVSLGLNQGALSLIVDRSAKPPSLPYLQGVFGIYIAAAQDNRVSCGKRPTLRRECEENARVNKTVLAWRKDN